jgi:hypothetical protein
VNDVDAIGVTVPAAQHGSERMRLRRHAAV